MILLLHGENNVASRRALNEKIQFFKAEGSEIIRIDGRLTNLTEVKQASEAGSLFGSDRLIALESFFSRPESKEKKEIIAYYQKLTWDVNLIFWESKSLTASQLKKIPGLAKVLLFKIQPIIFKFLDAFYPGNSRPDLQLLLQCQQVEDAEMIFYMLCRQIRTLILAKDLGNKGLAGMPFWMQNKFMRQARCFSLEQLLKIHQKLLTIDYEIKTGLSLMPLSFHLDLLVANL